MKKFGNIFAMAILLCASMFLVACGGPPAKIEEYKVEYDMVYNDSWAAHR